MHISPQYWAGFFDGEGTVSLCYMKIRPRLDGKGDVFGFKFQVKIGNTHREIMDQMAAHYGGSVYKGQNRDASRFRDTFCVDLQVAARQLVFLSDIAPYCVVKKEQVGIGLRYLGTAVRPGQRLAPGSWEVRMECHRRLKELNRRGPEAPVKYAIPELHPEGWRPSLRHSPEDLSEVMAHVRDGLGKR